jgi:hypothetical protein
MFYKDGSYLVKYFQKTIAKEFLNYKEQKKDIRNVNILASGAITTTGIVEDLNYRNIQEYLDNEKFLLYH